MKRTTWARAVALVAVIVLLAAACGDDDDTADTGSSTTEGSSDTTGGTGGGDGGGGECDDSKEPLKIGGVAQVANFAGIEEGAKARIEVANQTCVGGHKLEWVGMRDDASDSQKNIDALRELVEQEEVFAVIATSANLTTPSTNYLAEKKVPFFGWGFMPGFCGEGSWGFGFNGCLSGYALNALGAVEVPDAKLNGSLTYPNAEIVGKPVDEYTVVVLNAGDESGVMGDTQYQALWPGAQTLASESVPVQGVTDYTQWVNIVNDKNPDVVIVSTDFTTSIKLKAAIIQSGYEGIVVDYTTYIPGLLESSPDTAAALEGGYSNSQFPAAEDGGQATEDIAAALEAIGEAPFVTQGASIGWWSADVMIQMLEDIEGDITPESFEELANSGWEYEPVDGGIGPISYPEGHSNPAPCAGLVKVEDGKYVSALKFACYDLLDPPSK
jgi:ABC-type branched-subunit amino acid transport system substrate-binding protein